TYRGAYPVGSYTCCAGTWQVALLPYIEQKALFDQYKGYGAMGPSGEIDKYHLRYIHNPTVVSQLIKPYTCPSDFKVAPRGTVTFHNYVGNHGNTSLSRKTPLGTLSNGQPNKYGKAPFISVSNTNSNPQVIRASDMSDGLSSTL